VNLTKDDFVKLYEEKYGFGTRVKPRRLNDSIGSITEYLSKAENLYTKPYNDFTDEDFKDFSETYDPEETFKFIDSHFFYKRLQGSRAKTLGKIDYTSIKYLEMNKENFKDSIYKDSFLEALVTFLDSLIEDDVRVAKNNFDILRTIELNEFIHNAYAEETLYEYLMRCKAEVTYACKNLIFTEYSNYSKDLLKSNLSEIPLFEEMAIDSFDKSKDRGVLKSFYTIKQKEAYLLTNFLAKGYVKDFDEFLFYNRTGVFLDSVLRKTCEPPEYIVSFEISKAGFELNEKKKDACVPIIKILSVSRYNLELLLKNLSPIEIGLILGVLYKSDVYRTLDAEDKIIVHESLASLNMFIFDDSLSLTCERIYELIKEGENVSTILNILIYFYNSGHKRNKFNFNEFLKDSRSDLDGTPFEWILAEYPLDNSLESS